MNIKDIQSVTVPEGAPLLDIFEAQLQLEENYHAIERETVGLDLIHPVDIHSHEGQARLKDLAFRCIAEIVESTECLKNKPWKQTPMETDIMHFREEVSDALHFFVAYCLAAGITAEQLYALYFAKHDVNKFRQRSKY